MLQMREWQQCGGYSGRESSVGPSHIPEISGTKAHPTCDLYRFMKMRRERRKQEGENVMGLLSYKIIRSTCLGFSKQLQVIVTCDVLQQRLTTAAMGRSVLLDRVKQQLRDWYMHLLRDLHIWSMWHPPCTCLFVEQSFSSSSSLSPSPYIAAVSLPGPGGKR